LVRVDRRGRNSSTGRRAQLRRRDGKRAWLGAGLQREPV